MISKMSLLVIWEILGVFVKRLTGDDNYPLWNCEDWRLPIQMKLSKNRKTLSQIFVSLLAFKPNFKHVEK